MTRQRRSDSTETELQEEPVATVAQESKPAQPQALIGFDKWFASTKRPVHHKAGIKAFLKGQVHGKKTLNAWNSLMSNY